VRTRFLGLIVFVVLAALLAGGAYWLSRPAKVSADKPKAAPAVGSCWNVDAAAAGSTFPWPGGPVDCAQAHTAEVIHVGQVDRELAAKAENGDDNDAKVSQNLMYAQARSACVELASVYLGAGWRTGRVRVVADWVKPQKTGHFGCALAEVADPTGAKLVSRTGSLRGALRSDQLTIGCVASLTYVPCDQPHDGEFTGTYVITPLDAPYDAAKVKQAAETGCAEVIGKYVRAPHPDLRTAYVGPTSGADWLGSDQTFACYAMSTTPAKLKGSVKGLGAGPLPR
jgi:hypothetical protein